MSEQTAYRDVLVVKEKIDENDILVLIVSSRESGGVTRYSFSIMKEYPKGQERKRSHWLDLRHIEAAKKLVALAEEKLVEALKVAPLRDAQDRTA